MMLHEELEQKNLKFQKFHQNLQLLNVVLPREQNARQKAEDLYNRIIEENYTILSRESNGHSPSFFLVDDATNEPYAILKQAKPEFYCSFKKFLPQMPLEAAVWEHEIIGFELDRLFSFNHVPDTLSVRFNYNGNTVNGVIQEYIPNSKDGSEFYHSQGAYLLKEIAKNTVHKLVLSGLFKGLSGGQMSNYLIRGHTIYEIDLETLLMPYNKLGKEKNLVVSNDLPTQDSYNSLILCRLWILGLPQSALEFENEILQIIKNPHLLTQLENYQKEAARYCRITQQSWYAQLERVKQMQEAVQNKTLTPRDLYFLLFGGEHLWKIAQEKRYPAMIAFNNFISDPYQHILKDFADLSKIPICKRLEEPKENTPESIAVMNFYRIMEGLEPILC